MPNDPRPLTPDLVSRAKLVDGAEIPTILLVEDNEYLTATMRMMIEGLGYRVRHAGDAQTALDLLDTGTPVDLVFSDIVMPGALNGLGLARKLRETKPDLPVVLTTGYAQAAQDAVAEGFRLLNKPFPADAFERLLREMLPLRSG